MMLVKAIRALLVSAALLTVSGASADQGATSQRPESGEFTAELNGVKQWYKVSGTGPVCLMPSPPWGCSSDLYFRTLKSMERRFTMVYLDSRGCGRSARAKADGDYRWDDLVADLDALRRRLHQDKVWLMGHSEGGVSVLTYACRYPDRVNGLVLLDAFAVTDSRAGSDMQARLNLRKNQPWYDDAMKGREVLPRTDAELTERIRRMLPLYLADPQTAGEHKADFAATTFSAAAFRGRLASKRMPFNLMKQLEKVTAPALIVVGGDDAFCSPVMATRIHLHLPHSKLLLIEHAGHFPWIEQANVFQTEVPKFLTALGLPAN